MVVSAGGMGAGWPQEWSAGMRWPEAAARWQVPHRVAAAQAERGSTTTRNIPEIILKTCIDIIVRSARTL